MSQFNSPWQQKITELTQQYHVSESAIMTLWEALVKGNGTMAQFNHPELGGVGQWLPGGMVMVSDMSNSRLKMVVDNLCRELTVIMNSELYPAGEQQQQQSQAGTAGQKRASSTIGQRWWPEELGMPSAQGGQNEIRYAYFADKRRLVLDINGKIAIYDTHNHHITSISQQQGSSIRTILFTSQDGTFEISHLSLVSSHSLDDNSEPATESTQYTDIMAKAKKITEILPRNSTNQPKPVTSEPKPQEVDVFDKIKKLAELKQQGIISELEFESKKAELLSRL